MCPDFLGHSQSLFVGDGLHLSLSESIYGTTVVSQIELGADQDDGNVGGMVFNLREPLHPSGSVSGPPIGREGEGSTLALTLSNDGGLTMEKQIRKTSVCG